MQGPELGVCGALSWGAGTWAEFVSREHTASMMGVRGSCGPGYPWEAPMGTRSLKSVLQVGLFGVLAGWEPMPSGSGVEHFPWEAWERKTKS